MTDQLREQITALFRDGSLYRESPAGIADAVLGVVVPEVERLRARVHKAVDETQRRYAKYQSRCDNFDTWAKRAREYCEQDGGMAWGNTSEYHRLYVLLLHEEIARLRREVEFEANGADTFSGADAGSEVGDV